MEMKDNLKDFFQITILANHYQTNEYNVAPAPTPHHH